MLELRIAWRFLWRSKAQSILIIFGIGVGIAVQVFVGSLITSLQQSLLDSTVGSSSHVTIEPAAGEAAFTFSGADGKDLQADPRIMAVAPVQIVSALVPVGETSAPVVVKGGTLEDIDSIYKLSDKIVAGEVTLAGDRILVGKEFAEQYGLAPGDPVELGAGRRIEHRGTLGRRLRSGRSGGQPAIGVRRSRGGQPSAWPFDR